MSSDTLVKLFVHCLSPEKRVKLYAALLLSENPLMARQAAMSKAHFSKPDDLRFELIKILDYGPRSL